MQTSCLPDFNANQQRTGAIQLLAMFLIASIIGDISHDVTGSGFVSFDTCNKACIIYTSLKLVSSRVPSGGKLFCLVLTERNIKPQCRDRCEQVLIIQIVFKLLHNASLSSKGIYIVLYFTQLSSAGSHEIGGLPTSYASMELLYSHPCSTL